MIKKLLLIPAFLMAAHSATAQTCGWLDFDEDTSFYLDSDGLLYDMDGNEFSELVPNVESVEAVVGKNKVMIEDKSNSNSQLLKFTIKPLKGKGKAIVLSQKKGNFLAFIDESSNPVRMVSIDIDSGEVLGASVPSSVKRKKIKLAAIGGAVFTADDCSPPNDNEDLPEDSPDDSPDDSTEE